MVWRRRQSIRWNSGVWRGLPGRHGEVWRRKVLEIGKKGFGRLKCAWYRCWMSYVERERLMGGCWCFYSQRDAVSQLSKVRPIQHPRMTPHVLNPALTRQFHLRSSPAVVPLGPRKAEYENCQPWRYVRRFTFADTPSPAPLAERLFLIHHGHELSSLVASRVVVTRGQEPELTIRTLGAFPWVATAGGAWTYYIFSNTWSG